MAEDAITREWRERLERWEGSRLGASDFAEQESVSVSTLYRWSRRLELGPVKLSSDLKMEGPSRGSAQVS
jgi:hypothetical protein